MCKLKMFVCDALAKVFLYHMSPQGPHVTNQRRHSGRILTKSQSLICLKIPCSLVPTQVHGFVFFRSMRGNTCYHTRKTPNKTGGQCCRGKALEEFQIRRRALPCALLIRAPHYDIVALVQQSLWEVCPWFAIFCEKNPVQHWLQKIKTNVTLVLGIRCRLQIQTS